MADRTFPPELFRLYDDFAHGRLSRAEFLALAGRFATGGMTAAALLAALSPDYARAAQVAEDDPAIATSRVEYVSPAGHGKVRGYLVRPTAPAGGRPPGVVVVHENRGLNPYIEDVARRLGAAGFLALAPDGLTPLGGYPGTDEKGKELQATLDPARLVADFAAAVRWLAAPSRGQGRVGVVGFCFGGWVAHTLAETVPAVAAAVPFYGRQPDPGGAARVRAPLLVHLAETDERVNAGWPAYEAALAAAGARVELHRYPGTQHGFHNDTTPRFDPTAAALAWARTLAFFRAHLA